MKYYMCDESEYILTLDDVKIMFQEDYLEEIKLEEMQRDYGGEMYCEENEVFVKKCDCGKSCSMYSPCNGKGGRCRYLKNGFIGTGRKFLLTEDRLKEVKIK